ncbi:MAG: MATE family efflux transporter, partial [Clostridia bacterium]|nr:MATE family efflux transporter [Clostridia bacterium]
VCVAQFVGARKEKDVSEVVHTEFSLSLIMGVAVGAFGYLLAEPALRAMGTLETTLVEAVPYMKAYMVGVPGVMVYNYCAAALRAKGDSVRPLIFLAISGFANVLLNLWMVLGFGMGAVGVGIATAASQYLAALIVVCYMGFFLKDSCHLSLRRMGIKRDKVAMMLKIGIPAGVQGVLFSFSNVLIQSSIQSFGTEALVNGSAAASNVEGFVYTAQNAAYQGAITFVGQHVGARKYERINRVIAACLGLTVVAGVLFGAVVLLLGEPLLGFFVDDPEAIGYGMLRMEVIVTTYFLCGVMEVGCGTLRGMGKTFLPMIVSLAGACGFRIIWLFTIFQQFHTPTCLFLSYPISWVLTLAVHFYFVFRVKRRLERENAVGKAPSQATTA